MNSAQFLLFIPTALLLAIAPGPDNLGVLALGLSAGRRASFGFALGCAAGCLNHTLLAVLGVSALIAASPMAFKTLQWAGAAYLVWIGWQSLRQSLGRNAKEQSNTENDGHFLPHFKRGLIANAINPKVALFFLAFLPQFVQSGSWGLPQQLGVLGILFTLISALVFCMLAASAGGIGSWLKRSPRALPLLQGATGLLFMALALRLILTDGVAPPPARPA
ncbi:LysE family translocator [Uliginosibacterium sp. 31-16]|uniref:LysE family translocator n=1 Tax=Uliginosibacterium sp. 31-16 TaxID=3068315 RepID=UPI00273F5570|nr:LysE family translocator [Uliginosibacterium sp. 31-16]MDP5241406.1 LysE family translocator [Uliginosibacterium sp. 31-16]